MGTLVIPVLLATLATSAAQAQKFAGQAPIPSSVPSPVLLDTTGMFLARYAKVGEDLFIA